MKHLLCTGDLWANPGGSVEKPRPLPRCTSTSRCIGCQTARPKPFGFVPAMIFHECPFSWVLVD